MLKYIIKRLLTMIPVVIGISFIIFAILAMMPGDPAMIILGDGATPEALAELREEMGLNDFFLVRFFDYFVNAIQGDFGTSYRTGLPVINELMARLPNTFALALMGVGLASLIGVPVGIISAVKQYSLIDNSIMAIAMIMTSIPGFWLGLMNMLLFALILGWLPAIGADSWQSFILPTVSIAVGNMAVIIRMTRSSMLEVIREDYIRTARAKGAAESTVILKHALRNALLPVITTIGLNFGVQIGGALIVETVFSIPGLGTLLITSVRQQDVPTVMAAVLFISLAISIVTLIMDVVYSALDPRVQLSANKAR